jgi:uncharacterized membrane protein
MANARIIYAAFIAVMLLLNLTIWITPFLAFGSNPAADTLYNDVFVYFCHQKISRSLCLFQGPDGYFIADCTPQDGTYVPNDSQQIAATHDGVPGYKLPVCARDIAIYLAMLLAGIAYPFLSRLDRRIFPDPLYLVMALIPIGVDGGLQLLSNLGINLPFIGMYESTNLMRLLTGFIAGAVIPFYLLPILNRILSKESGKPLKSKKEKE